MTVRRDKRGTMYECTTRDLLGSAHGVSVFIEGWQMGARRKNAVCVEDEPVYVAAGGIAGRSDALTFAAGMLAGLAHAARRSK